MLHERRYDVVVVGGGLSGVCAAIAAARCGVKVALVQDRPLLGGNASGELRIHIAGADCSGSATARYVRETGIIDEIRIENLKRNYADSHEVLSLICREMVEREANIELFLNTHARRVLMRSPETMEAVEADQVTSEKEFAFFADMFIDCTGDGSIAAKAGAAFRFGREAASEFGESLAPEQADSKTLPSCVEFYLKDMGRPVPFDPPQWAHRFESQIDLPFRSVDRSEWQFGNLCGGFWWLSTGGQRNVIDDNEEIYRDLLGVVMGLWDLMKNRGEFGAENYSLDWVSPIPGKRESRRIEGDYILNQNDVLSARVFDDAVAYGGWPIDIHPPEGIFSKNPPNFSVALSKPYTIPLRCLYSRTHTNLWIAGRNISVSHIALGTTRVMATCAVIGQAAGVAAATACQGKLSSRQTTQTKISQIRQTLRRQGAYIPFCRDGDPNDLARRASVTASSESLLIPPSDGSERTTLSATPFQIFPVSGDRLTRISVLLEAEEPCEVTAGLRKVESIWDTGPGPDTACWSFKAPQGRSWVELPTGVRELERGLYLLWLKSDKDADWVACSDSPLGLVRGALTPPERAGAELGPKHSTMRGCFAFRVEPESRPYCAVNVTSDVGRPESWPNAWISRPIGEEPEWLELRWPSPTRLSEVDILFDASLDSNLTWPPPLGVFGCEGLPGVATEYEIQAILPSGATRVLCREMDNYQPHRTHIFKPVNVIGLRLLLGIGVQAKVLRISVY